MPITSEGYAVGFFISDPCGIVLLVNSCILCPCYSVTFVETTARDSDRQCKAMEAQLAEMDDLRHVDMELKKTQSKLDR